MAACRTCGKDTGTRYLWDDEFCSPECAFDDEYLTTTFKELPDNYREAEGQLDLPFDEKDPTNDLHVGHLLAMVLGFLVVLYIGFSIVDYFH